jgi:type IV pilus modification protein PilV
MTEGIMTEIKPVLNENGFTLIETMLAIAIMAIGLLALASLQVTAIGGNAQSKKRTLALALAEDKIETYRHTAYASIPAGQEVETGLETLYTRNTLVENDTPVTDVKTVTVTVYWYQQSSLTQSQKDLRSVSLRTIIANYGS